MTNCPNCGAPIVAAQCEYCGTRFDHVVIRSRTNRLEDERHRLEIELLEAKTKALVNTEILKGFYTDALKAMRNYGRSY